MVLSGCDSARAAAPRPGYWFGLADVLLATGAQRVIASRRPLVDASALRLIELFYGELRTHAPARALQRASLRARSLGIADWNSLVLYGGR